MCITQNTNSEALWDEDDSIEIQHLAHKVEELGIGISLNVNDDFILPSDVTKYRESFKKLNLNGYLKFVGNDSMKVIMKIQKISHLCSTPN